MEQVDLDVVLAVCEKQRRESAPVIHVLEQHVRVRALSSDFHERAREYRADLTPELAKICLENLAVQREIRPSRVDRYAADSVRLVGDESAVFVPGSTMRIAPDGLADGQHRCKVTVETGITLLSVRFIVDLTDGRTAKVTDQGSIRSVADLLHGRTDLKIGNFRDSKLAALQLVELSPVQRSTHKNSKNYIADALTCATAKRPESLLNAFRKLHVHHCAAPELAIAYRLLQQGTPFDDVQTWISMLQQRDISSKPFHEYNHWRWGTRPCSTGLGKPEELVYQKCTPVDRMTVAGRLWNAHRRAERRPSSILKDVRTSPLEDLLP